MAANATSFVDSTVAPGNSYTYYVVASDGTANSATSLGAAISIQMTTPGNVAATMGQGAVTVTWTDSDICATGFYIDRSTNGGTAAKVGTVNSSSGLSFTDSTVLSGHVYKYEVEAFDAYFTSSFSAFSSALTLPLAAPYSLSTSMSGSAVKLQWTDSDSNATGYTVWRATNGGTTFTKIATISSASTTTYQDTSVAGNTSYQYEIQAIDAVTTSAFQGPVSISTPLTTPGSLTATLVGQTVRLTWNDSDPGLTDFAIYRATDGAAAIQLTTVAASASSYVDSTVAPGNSYTYYVAALAVTANSAASSGSTIVTPLTAPGNVSATLTYYGASVTWTDSDTGPIGFYILRSTNGAAAVKVGTAGLSGGATFTDATVSSGHTYKYEVEAYDTYVVSPASAYSSTLAVALAAPSGLTATLSGTSVQLAWIDNDSAATQYAIFRTTDGGTQIKLTALSSASANSYTDTSVQAGHTYVYAVEAVNSVTTSAFSGAASVTTPSSNGGGGTSNTVTIATRYGDELVIALTGTSNTVSVNQSGSQITVVADGHTSTYSLPAGGVFVYTRGGTDQITVGSGVTVWTTLGDDRRSGDDDHERFIRRLGMDHSTDSFSGSGTVHSVAAFAGGVSKTAGSALADPSDAGTTTKVVASLWGTGPVMADENQGGVGDCYFMATLAAFANTNPTALRQMAVDMGDGTSVVEFYNYANNNTPTFVRVADDFSVGP